MKSFPKPEKYKKSKPKKDKAYLNWVASQGCMIPGCANPPCVHHIRELGELRDDRKTIPLCHKHHQGDPEGLHFMGKKLWAEKFGSELCMLEELMKNKG